MIEIGHKLTGTVNKITEKGCYCSLGISGFGFMPKNLMDGLVDNEGNYLISNRDKVDVYVHNINEQGYILLSSVKSYETAQEKKRRKMEKIEERRVRDEKLAYFVEHFEPGLVFEAEVVKIKKTEVLIRLGNYEGVIPKEEIEWNEINKLEDLLYEGEKISAVFLRYDDEQKQLYFSLKYLKEKPYEESYYDLNTRQLLSYMGHISNTFIGVVKKYGNWTFIENLYSACDKTMGKLLVDPIYGYNLRTLVLDNNEVEDGEFYKVNIKLTSKEKRLQRNQLFQFYCTSIEKSENPYQSDVSRAFMKRTGDPSANQTIAGLLKTVSKDMYSSKDRMFFELVQNADDASAEKGVFIDVSSIGDYLVIYHNGYSFDKDDFEAITTAANGTKKANENKTGYKGIGFKSVFTDSVKVFISTGGYNFMFDKDAEIFQDFDKFYVENNPILRNLESRQEYLRLYESERRKFDKTNSIPWQLEPIWVNQFPKELGHRFSHHNVAIALMIGEHKLLGENGYIAAINEIISNPIFMLFLRNTNRIDFNERSISKSYKNNVITLKNSFNDRRVELFERVDFEIPVTNESFEKNNVDIRIVVEEEDEGKITEAKFVDLKNQVFENIPKKIAITNATTLSFAVPINEDGTLNPICKRTEISMFAFLPTLVKDFKFPFYVNANFILDPPRQRILGDNPWNFYLMQEIAKNLVKWCATLSSRGDLNALNVLMPVFFEEDTPDTRQLAGYFNASYKEAIESESFIQNHNGRLSKQNEILIDKTGLSEIIGAQLFCDVIGTSKALPNFGVNSTILEKRSTFEQIEVVKLSDISSQLSNSELLRQWVKTAPPEQLSQFIEWLKKNQAGCGELVKSLPLFEFVDGYKSRSDIQNDSLRIITTEKIHPIRNVLGQLGFYCSVGVFDNQPFFELVDGQKEKEIFERISGKLPCDTLSLEDKMSLIRVLVEFNGVGETMISNLVLFNNEVGVPKPLAEMTKYKESYPLWLHPYVLHHDEFGEELSKYLIEESSVFDKIITVKYDEIDVPLYDLHQQFIDKWSGLFTKKLIDKYGPVDTLLHIVEKSDSTTQQYFLSKIARIDLKETEKYDKDSFVYRVLKIALSVLDNPSVFSTKIYFNGCCIKDFSIKDSVNCEYMANGVTKKVTLSLARLLPNYQDKSGLIEKVIHLFEIKTGLEKFFDAKHKPIAELYSELNTLLGIPHQMYYAWKPGLGNAQQYPFSVFRRKQSWTVLKGMQIQLEKESKDFIVEMMDILYSNNIEIATSPFTDHLKVYFIDKFFRCGYAFETECISETIEKWADDPKKKDYLLRNGVRDISCDAIRFRQLFLGNNPIDDQVSLSDKDILSAITFIANVSGFQRPYLGQSQKDVLLKLRENHKCQFGSQCNFVELVSISQEWDTKEYKEWRIEHNSRIFLFDGQLPMELSWFGVVLTHFSEGYYIYDVNNKIIYISRDVELDSTLFEMARSSSGLNLGDYRALCMSGKVSVSKDEIETKDKQISTLMKDNEKKDELLRRYRERYGNLDDEIDGSQISDGCHEGQAVASPTLTIKRGENQPLSTAEKIDAQINAQKKLKELYPSWKYPEGFGEGGSYPCFNVIKTNGEIMSIVLKSHRTDDPLHVTTNDWDWIMGKKEHKFLFPDDGVFQQDYPIAPAKLFIYTGDDIKELDPKHLIENQPSIALSFSTINLDMEERITAFSDSLHYFNEMSFDFESFNLSNKAKSIKDIYNTNIGLQNNLSDEEAL